MIFFACSECGGSNDPATSTVDVTASTKYAALTAGNELKLLGVAAAGTQQQFLTGSTLPGFVWITADGVAIVNVAPELTLPDATSGAFTRLLVGTADDPAKWQMFVAPSTGNYTLAVMGGVYQLVGFGAIPLDTLGALGGTHTPLILAGIRNTGGSTWVTEKLAVAAQRVLVGDGDGVSVKALPTDEYLIHPLGQFNGLRLTSFTELDSGGAAIAGGIPVGTSDENEGVEDSDSVWPLYNITSKRFFRAATRTASETGSNADTAIPDNGTWQSMDPHCKVTLTFNYPNALVLAAIRLAITNVGSDPSSFFCDFGLFVDGAAIDGSPGPEKLFNVRGYPDNNVHFLMKGLNTGSHQIEIKCKKTAVVDQTLRCIESNMEVISCV